MKKLLFLLFAILFSFGANAQFFISSGIKKHHVQSIIPPYQAYTPTYYVSSSTGNDSNSGTDINHPWKTMTKVNSSTFSPDDFVCFRRGDVWDSVLVVSNSGTAGHPVTYGAYGGGVRPVISGWLTITSGWTNEGGGIYSKVITSDQQTNMVTIDGREYGMGRYPNSTYLTYESANTNISITDDQLTSTPNWTGAEVVIRKNDWRLDRCLISNHTGTTITYTNAPSSWNATPGNGYFIQNSLQTLDQFGEWYHDTSTGKFYMYFGAVDPTTKTVKVAVRNNVLVNSGKQYVSVRDLDIQGAIQNTIYNGLQSDNFTVQDCNISFAGDYGIYIDSNNGIVNNNTITDCNQVAVKGAGSIAVNVTSNTISRIGVIKGSSKSYYNAIMFNSNNDKTQISYNSIDSVGYDGILIYGDTTTIQYNYVNRTCLLLNDGGGIYTANSTGNNGMLIDHNIILNTEGNIDGGNTATTIAEGIYLDEYANNITVSNNTVAYSGFSGIKLHYAHDDVVDGNILFKNGNTGLYMMNNNGTDNMVNDTIRNNQFVQSSGGYTINILDLGATSPVAITSDYNYFIQQTGNESNIYTYYNSTEIWYSLSTWQSYSGKDANSTSVSIILANATLFYNATPNAVAQDLSGNTWKDLSGAFVTSKTLQPYTSVVLIKQ